MKRSLTLLIVLTLILTAAFASAEGVQKAYYNSEYAYLQDEDSVYVSLTLEEAYYLFAQEGNYLILLGGSWCGNTTPVIGYIDEVAKEYGVETIYNLDFRLDGANRASHVRETEGAQSQGIAIPGSNYNYLYGELASRFLTNLNDYVEYKVDTESAVVYTDPAGEKVTVPKVQVPFLFLYNKDNTDESGNAAPIVAGLELMKVRGDFVTDDIENTAAISEYKQLLRDTVFEAASKAELSSFTDADYIRLSYNEKSGRELFAPDEEIAFEVLTYKQLKWLLDQDGTHILFLGDSWCPNTQAVVKIVNDYALANGVTVYNFDIKLDGGYARRFWGYEKDLHIRDNNSEFANLYVDLVLDYFHNIETEYTLESGNTIHYENADGETLTANKLQVPYLLVYTKGLEDDYAHFVPISAYIEKMLTLDETREDYVYAEENYKAYTDGVFAVFEAWADLTGGSAVRIAEQ